MPTWGTYDGDYVYTETYYGPYHNMIETSSFDETYEGAVVKKSGSDALDIDGGDIHPRGRQPGGRNHDRAG